MKNKNIEMDEQIKRVMLRLSRDIKGAEKRKKIAKCLVHICNTETSRQIKDYNILIGEAVRGKIDDEIKELLKEDTITPSKLFHILYGAFVVIAEETKKTYKLNDLLNKAIRCVKDKTNVREHTKEDYSSDSSGDDRFTHQEPDEDDRKKRNNNPFKM